MSNAPFMQLFVSDYLGDTQHLTTEQHGAYLLILMAMWRGGGRFPNDQSKLARVARVSPRRWHMISVELMEFFDLEDGYLSQKRLVREYKKVVSISQKRSISGKAGGSAKALKSNETTVANAKQLPKHTQIPDTIYEKDTLNRVSKKTGSRLEKSWSPSQGDRSFAEGLGLQRDQIDFEADKFRDFWTSKTGANATKIDWPATWRNWVRNVKPANGTPRPKPESEFMQKQRRFKKDLEHELGISAPVEDGFGNVIDLEAANFRSVR